jgi:apolipoprotein N-acyltransferase
MQIFTIHKSISHYFIALLSGCLLPLAFAPFNFYCLAWIIPAILLFTWNQARTAKQAGILGFLFGLGLYSVGTSWVYISIHRYGNAGPLLAGFITILLILLMSSVIALQGYLFTKCFPKQNAIKILMAYPASWVLCEWLRAIIFSGFPWMLLGYSQTDSYLNCLIPLLGVYGVSLIIVLFSSILFYVGFASYIKKILCFLLLIAAFFALQPLQHTKWTEPSQQPVHIAMIQGNIAQEDKWQNDKLINILRTYVELSADQWQNPIVIWPEGAIPLPYNYAKEFTETLTAEINRHHSSLITGIPIAAADADHYYNGIITLGNAKGIYHKRHLVPFGEYVPLEKYLRGIIGFLNIPMSSFVAGDWQQTTLQAAGVSFAPYICYEVAFPELITNTLGKAQVIVVLSDDNWFGHSIAAAQQFQMARFHAKETGRYLLSATNSGITAIVNAQGQVMALAPSYQEAVLTGQIEPMQGLTPILKIGTTPIFGGIWGIFLLALLLQWRPRNLSFLNHKRASVTPSLK